jgi:hypothetical protein
MTPAKPGLIRGVVVAADGRPVAGARVFFRAGPGSLPDIAALTGEDGAFALTAPREGTYEVAAAADDAEPVSAMAVVTARETATTVTLRFPERR